MLANVKGNEITADRQAALERFCANVGIKMTRYDLLSMALTHSSYAFEQSKKQTYLKHNERIEFLGDSVLSVIVSTYMFGNFHRLNEGKLTKFRAHLVCESSLYKFATKIHLGDYLLLGHGEERSGSRNRPSVLADAFESVLGAIYLECGLEVASEYILRIMKDEINLVCTHGIYDDYKSYLQEYLQQNGEVHIVYTITGSFGAAHEKTFCASVSCNDAIIGNGEGKSKKDAEQHAAKNALEKLNLKIKL
ncbi:MAG: ribonuclease III [Phascolarctobacterium sp.]|nr:ribonuclease III [Phascolarctobacterium sp.]